MFVPSRLLLSLLLRAGCAATLAFGQTTTGTITGVVTDATGAIIPGAAVSITNKATGVNFDTTTNDDGIYNAPSLRADSYTVQVQLQGFKTLTQEVTLQTAQTLRLDLALETGNISETVEVESSGELLARDSAEVATSISAREITNLPLKDRSPYGALQVVPGFESESSDPSGRTSGTFSINGSRALNTQISIDGINIQAVSGIGERVASLDALQEVKVLTSTYSAEYAQTQGGSVLFQVKSGGQDFHGSLFTFHRNNALNAGNWADNARGLESNTTQRTEAGGTIGGPLALPRFGEGGPALLRNKVFFFVSYEGTINREGETRLRSIPSLAIRNGDFSGLRTASGAPLVYLRDPARTGVCNQTSQAACFSDGGVLNRIPQNRLDPAARRILQLLPAPNAAGDPTNSFGINPNNYVNPVSLRERQNLFVGRLDIAPTNNDKLYFTYRRVEENQIDTGQDFLSALNSQQGLRVRAQNSGALNYSHIFGPNLSNEALVTLYRDNRVITPYYADFNAGAQLGIARTLGTGLPTINFAGNNTFSDFGNSFYNDGINQNLTLQNITTYLRGRHTFRVGPQLYQHQEPYFAATNAAGTYDFSGAITGNGNPGLNNPIYSFADFLIGSVRSASAPAPQLPTNRTSYDFGIFIQDDFKVSQRLTLNLGLRYEVEFLPTSRNDILSRIDPVTGGLLVAGRNATRNLDRDPDYFNLSPRIGLAYSFNDKTVIRSGFGIVHGTTYQDYGPRQQFTGFSFTQSFPGIGTNQAREFTLSQGFPTTAVAGPADPFQRLSVATVTTPLPVQGPTFFPEDPRPYVMQWTGSVQREIGFGTVAEIAYVGSRGVHLSRVYEGNNPTIDVADDLAAAGATNLQQRFRPFPTLSNFLVTSYDATSNYNSLQAKVNRRFAQGLSMQASYTLSKSMDDASNGFGRGEITNNQIPWQFKQLERAVSDLDRRHNFNLNALYDLPFGDGRRFFSGNRALSAIFGGFQLNALVSAGSGRPFTITQNLQNFVLNAQRPNIRAGFTDLSGRVEESFIDPGRLAAVRYLIPVGDPNFAFERSGRLGIGNVGRNTVYGPGFKNLNLGLFREFSFTEQVRLQGRLEAFNALNIVNFGNPDTNIDSVNYGLITTATPARVLQVGLRLRF
ncbi:MAG TPA: TonB-dependent receptor [Pyrinomonadaceae bacterium]|nr:TonB-dependent receptor [Pyrinomonadaceae bacterium]